MLGNTYQKIVADAGYESEEHYVYLAGNQQQAYIKPVNYERMKTGKFKKDISKRENMSYDCARDEYTCVPGRTLKTIGTGARVSASGYKSELTIYECESSTPLSNRTAKPCG